MSEYRECDRCGKRIGMHSEEQVNYNRVSLDLTLRSNIYDPSSRQPVDFDLCGQCSLDYKKVVLEFRDNLKDSNAI